MVYDATVPRVARSVLRNAAGAIGAASGLAVWLLPSIASADPVWVDRRLTLEQGEKGVDLGLGLADDLRDHVVGPGMFIQAHYGLTDASEISVREGVNFGLYGRYSRASQYGRLYTLDGSTTPGPGPTSNPDLVYIGRFADFGFLELSAEVEMGFPVEPRTHLDGTFGVAVTMHIANFMRIDTGGFMSATLRSPSTDTYAFPLQLWFEPSELIPLWFGPLLEFKTTGASDKWTIPGGIGIGYAVNPDIDVRAEVFVPSLNITPGDRVFGGGIGATYRFR